MALPKLSTPEFKTKIPSTGQEITYRPFLVKEEKILLMAMEGNDQKEITNSIMNLLSGCILDEVDVRKLATFDIEYIFLKLRGKSVGEVIQFKTGHVKETECKHRSDGVINIDDIVPIGEIKDPVIMLTDEVGVKVHYPSLADLDGINATNETGLIQVLTRCIDQVFDKDEVYTDFSEAEISDWVDGLDQQQFKKLADFFNNMPKLSYTYKWTCKECGEEDQMELEGLQSFFSLR